MADLKGNNRELISLFLCSVAGHGVGLYPGADRVTVYNGNNIISFSKQETICTLLVLRDIVIMFSRNT